MSEKRHFYILFPAFLYCIFQTEECTIDNNTKNTYILFDSANYVRIAESGINGLQYDNNL